MGGWGQSFVTSFSEGVLLFVTKCDEGGGGVKNRPNCVTSFMDGPQCQQQHVGSADITECRRKSIIV